MCYVCEYIQRVLSKSVSRRVGAGAVINQCMYRLLTIITMGHFGKWPFDVRYSFVRDTMLLCLECS